MAKPKPARRAGRRVTLRNIADYAGVSVGAASSVLTNRHIERRISRTVVERIRAAAQKLGYIPDINARRLRSGTRRQHNVILAFITSYEAPLSLASDLVTQLRELVTSRRSPTPHLSFSVMMEMFAAGRLHEMPGLLSGDHFNAAIITNTTPEDDLFLASKRLPFPAVLVNRNVPEYSCVVEDTAAGAAVGRLFHRGRRRNLAVLHGLPLTHMTRSRVESFMRNVADATGKMPAEIVADGLTVTSAHEATARFLDSREKVDALYAVGDALALGAYHALKERGLGIPRNTWVVGVGDHEISPFFDPPLTVVGVERSLLGLEASRLLLRQFQQPGAAPAQVEIPVKTVLRASTGPTR